MEFLLTPDKFSELEGVHEYAIDLKQYFEIFLKKNCAKKLQHSRFKIFASKGCGLNRNFSDIWRDAMYTFILSEKSFFKKLLFKNLQYNALACIGFDIIEKNLVLVNQIQGTKGNARKLRVIKWERMLLQIVVDWATANSLSSVGVIIAEQNAWYRVQESKQMKMRYNITAKRCGFKFSEEKKCHIKNLAKKH
jgi:hypothetical protein